MNKILKRAKELEEWFKNGEERNYPYWITRKKEETTELLKKAREGCGEEFDNEELKIFMHCGNRFANTNKQLCPDCQEVIKILDCVLEEKGVKNGN